jgi:hypothetical protein
MYWPDRVTTEDLNAASFPLRRLHPERDKVMTFLHKKRNLVGMVQAKGNSDDAITVKMLPAATVTGRLIDAEGKPAAKQLFIFRTIENNLPIYMYGQTDKLGVFSVDKLLPNTLYASGWPYPLRQGWPEWMPSLENTAGVLLPAITLEPGETRDLGTLRLQKPVQ